MSEVVVFLHSVRNDDEIEPLTILLWIEHIITFGFMYLKPFKGGLLIPVTNNKNRDFSSFENDDRVDQNSSSY